MVIKFAKFSTRPRVCPGAFHCKLFRRCFALYPCGNSGYSKNQEMKLWEALMPLAAVASAMHGLRRAGQNPDHAVDFDRSRNNAAWVRRHGLEDQADERGTKERMSR
jgi:hypothetical protein